MQERGGRGVGRRGAKRVALGLIALLIGAMGLLAAAATSEDDAAEPAPVHESSSQLVEAMQDTLGALLLDDAASARSALDRVNAQIREPKAEEQEVFGRDLISYARAVRGTLNVARETSSAGNLDRAFNEFISIQKTCGICHGFARNQGLLEAR